jgi:hypothetical protein
MYTRFHSTHLNHKRVKILSKIKTGIYACGSEEKMPSPKKVDRKSVV